MRLGRPVLLAALALAAAPPAAPAAQTVRAGPLTGTVDDGVGVRVERSGAGVTAVHLSGPAGARTVSIRFPARRGERLTGFGERSNAVDQRGRDVLNYTADGPFLEADQTLAGAATPDWAEVDSRDATYYPVPWLLSSRGYGVLVDNDETSRFLLGADGTLARRGRRRPARPARLRRPAPGRRAAALHRGDRPPARPAGALGLRALVPDRPAERGPARRGGAHLPQDAQRGRAGVGRRDPDALPALRRAPRSTATTSSRARGSSTPRGWRTSPTSTRTSATPTSRSSTRPWRPERSSAARTASRSRSRRSSAARAPAGFTHRAARAVRLHRAGRAAALRAPAERGGRAGQGRLDGGLRRVDVARRGASRRDGAGTHPQPLPARLPLRRARHRARASGVRWCASSARAGRARRAAPSTSGAGIPPPSGASTGCARPSRRRSPSA